MANQRYRADPKTRRVDPNGAVVFASGDFGPHYARVENCPIEGTKLRVTCYATGDADTFFSIPACTQVRRQYIKGFFTVAESGVVFVAHSTHHRFLRIESKEAS